MKNKKMTAGFTLVELIVVIAILGILAGVGTVGYSGYIKKANEAADQQLLGFVNQAFAAACIENGKDINDVTSASIGLSDDKEVESISPYSDAFFRYFAGNETTAFKVIESLVFDSGLHRFVDPTSTDGLTLTYKGITVTVSGSAVSALKESTWGTLGSENLLSLVDNVSLLAQSIENGTYAAMVQTDGFVTAAMAVLGETDGTYTSADYQSKIYELANAEAERALAAGEITSDQFESYRATVGQKINSNTTILVAAQNSNSAATGIIDLLTANGGADAKESIKKAMTGENPTEGLAQAALAYSLYSSYMYSTDPDNFDSDETPDFSTVMNTLTGDGFQNYLKDTDGTGQVQKDLEGYLAAMDTLTNNSEAANDVILNGFSNADLVKLMQDVMGN